MLGNLARRMTGQIKQLGLRLTSEVRSIAGADSSLKRDRGPAIFPEIDYMRLADVWIAAGHDPSRWGGIAADKRIYQQYKLKWAPSVNLEFWYRGFAIAPEEGQAFRNLLCQAGRLGLADLKQVRPVLGNVARALDPPPHNYQCEIESAEVGPLRGRNVLMVKWHDRKARRTIMSVFLDALSDGCTVREIHFSADESAFKDNESFAVETLRTLQWATFAPPPLSR